MTTAMLRHAMLLIGVSLLGVHCTEKENFVDIGQALEGDSCKRVSDCRAGLLCIDRICTRPAVSTRPRRGAICINDADCAPDFVCGRQNVCTVSKGQPLGSPCGILEDCEAPLICHGDGTCAVDDDGVGTFDVDEACTMLSDCRRPYVCGLASTCTQVPLYTGVNCTASDQERGAFRAYFEVPPETIEGMLEFYRLPFPNDIRVRGGRVTMAGHPSPGDVLGVDIEATYLGTVNADVEGFATNQPVFLRLADDVDVSSLCVDPGSATLPAGYCTGGGDATVYLVNIDAGSGDFGQRLPVQMSYDAERGQYICQRSLAVAPLDGRPLAEGTTYAVIATTEIKRLFDAKPLQRGRDFSAMLADDAPMDAARPELDAAHAAYAPLRAWIDAQSIDADSIAGAAVFTTATASSLSESTRQAVHAAPIATFNNDALICDNGIVSPCEATSSVAIGTLPAALQQQILTRACEAADPAFFEVHGTISTPIFQSGTPPYTMADQGGHFIYNAGLPVVQRNEDLCYALYIPKGMAAPVGGWPVVIYGHGTGGSFRSAGMGGAVVNPAELLTGLGFAVLGFDNISHGRRQTGSDDGAGWEADPGSLFFNVRNPRASRDNVLQGAADLFSLTRLLRAASVDLDLGNGAAQIDFNANEVYFLGHSQGTVIGAPFVAFEPDIEAAVFSGAGAELALSILFKTSPVNLKEGAQVLFGDQDLNRLHPILGLFSMIFAPSDAIAYAEKFFLMPPLGRTSTPYLHFSGVTDTATPDQSQHALMRAAGSPLIGLMLGEMAPEGVSAQASPAQNNVVGSGGVVTAGAIQLTPTVAGEGHFVMFNHPDADDILMNFFQTALAGTAEIER